VQSGHASISSGIRMVGWKQVILGLGLCAFSRVRCRWEWVREGLWSGWLNTNVIVVGQTFLLVVEASPAPWPSFSSVPTP